ncbi:MAG: efflux RND transporter permease subunit [Deltaproteobacteria bacterium]|nr:efflux RND transporter permease subunit [Deltaproteobacteria bacterium]
MKLQSLSINRPVLISCAFFLTLLLGYLGLKSMPVDLFPDIAFPIITVTTIYPGTTPTDIETLVSKPLEDELSTISGIKKLSSISREGMSLVVVEFNLETDIKDAEQQVRNHISFVRNKLPDDINEPVIMRVDPSNEPILMVALIADLNEGALYDLAENKIAPKLQQIPQVGLVELMGARKREIHVKVDLEKLKQHKIPASQLARTIALSGKNIPIGKIDEDKIEKSYRLIGEYPTIADIRNTIITFAGNDVPVKVGDVATIEDTLEDEKTRIFVNGEKAMVLNVYKQSKTNTVKVADNVSKKVAELQKELLAINKDYKLFVVVDISVIIKRNILDVKESIFLGIALAIIVVLFFLGNFRSTIITGLALPNSLLGAFILMSFAGFSFNVMSLLGLSLAVGLLIDDAIVVRENIYRHIEMGKPAREAAITGTKEVTLAVIATTFTLLAVFGSVGFLQGVVGRFFREFGLSVCFAMIISLLDALLMAPMLSAYFAGRPPQQQHKKFILLRPLYFLLEGFVKFQERLSVFYERLLRAVLRHSLLSLGISLVIFVISVYLVKFIPKTFLPPQDFGDFMVIMEDLPGTNLKTMTSSARQVEALIIKCPEIKSTLLTVGDKNGQSNKANIYVQLVDRNKRTMNTTEFKEILRQKLVPFSSIAPKVTDVDMIGAGMRVFNVNIVGPDLKQLEIFAMKFYERIKNHPALLEPEVSHKPGKPEVQVVINKNSVDLFGVTSDMIGQEIRTLVEGVVPAVYREAGDEYDIRIRAKEDQRDLAKSFEQIIIPNINHTMIPLSKVASLEKTKGPVNINREDRERFIRISGDIRPKSVGMGGLMNDINKILTTDMPLPQGMNYTFVGQAENFKELIDNVILALLLGVAFIYLVLASLYESFITPFTIMLVLPLAACGAFIGLLVTGFSLDIFSMIGCILLMGLSTKNSILLVDYTVQLIAEGYERSEAIVRACRVRLRPVLMTSFALIAGMVPVAIGLNEASRQRMSMGIAVVGGLISSTLLTLIVIPAAFSYVDRFNNWVLKIFKKISQTDSPPTGQPEGPSGQ